MGAVIRFALVLSLWLWPLVAGADLYFNSAEPGCNPASPNPNYLLCDDWEDGDWAVNHCDAVGQTFPANDGWCGTIYITYPQPGGGNYALCGNQGINGTNCAASKGSTSPTGMIALHPFKGGGQSEFYLRWYYYSDPGSDWNHEKMMGFGSSWNGNEFRFINSYFYNDTAVYEAVTGWLHHNVSSFKLAAGRWHFIEVHMKLNSPGSANGTWEFWGDDCGTDGRGCTGTPTLRSRYTNVNFRTDNSLVSHIWLMNWSPNASNGATAPFSSGNRKYDQLIASKTGPIGFMGATAPPPQPVCGDGVRNGTEICDGTSGCAAPSQCVANCGYCLPPCPTCPACPPPPVCPPEKVCPDPVPCPICPACPAPPTYTESPACIRTYSDGHVAIESCD